MIFIQILLPAKRVKCQSIPLGHVPELSERQLVRNGPSVFAKRVLHIYWHIPEISHQYQIKQISINSFLLYNYLVN